MNDPNGFSFYQGKFHLFFSTIPIPPNGAPCIGGTLSARICSVGSTSPRHWRRIRIMMPTAVFPVRPLSWKTGGSFACVVGIRTEDESGAVLLFESEDGFRWHYVTVLDRSYNEFGKMWECPDFFSLEGEQVLLLSLLPAGFLHCPHQSCTFRLQPGLCA